MEAIFKYFFGKKYFSKYIFSYDYGGDYGGFFGSGFPSLFGAPRVRVVVVPVEEVLTCADSDDDGGGRDHGLNF